ncbi:MAG TPA: malonyl-ACP O-methyltransferase BioC [Spirochaetota bacterium]|nr:malonyl-ACP O-methyltransferase BioC [Spirochaetota bacterium]HOS31699.1 malonyl-ACP O-methyltransferase BioC [Spirochaetota bacterium]HOS54966.1 malonyl-ACP O-methyltransferase BioC [Spirochaetota bacterium]HQF78197.1 malonyl-ACP O-methyltransferase BioC [Spirochaetota bacterium]HQH30187.1 malonyl-ACP O-methyltransferase BioC [Spirochaetota bacterium]
MNKGLIRDNFDKYAVNYDSEAKIQRDIASELITLLPDRPYKNILEIGVGTGFFTEELLKKNEFSDFTANDVSVNMIETHKNKFFGRKIKYLTGNFEEAAIDNKYELIAGSAVFQWFTDLNLEIKRINKFLNINGDLLFSIFTEGTFYELDESFRKSYEELALPYRRRILNFYNFDEITGFLKNNDFDVIKISEKKIVINFDNPLIFLHSIRDIGAASFDSEKVGTVVMRKMIKNYKKLFLNKAGTIPATYNVLYCLARKKND